MRIGLFLSRDDGKISDKIDIDNLEKNYSPLYLTRKYDNFFNLDAHQDIINNIKNNKLDGIVLAGSSKKYYENMYDGYFLKKSLEEIGINENKIGYANIKEHVAYVHKDQKEQATKKAKLIIDVALSKIEICHNIGSIPVSPRKSVLIVGTTAGSLIAAKLLIERGYRVAIIDNRSTWRKHNNISKDMQPTITALQSNDKVTIIFNGTITDSCGWCGDYKVSLTTPDGNMELLVGGIILGLGNDKEWIEELRPKMHYDLDNQGFIKAVGTNKLFGQTRDRGIWFIPYSEESDRFSSEIIGASLASLELTSLLDRDEIQHPILVSEVNENVCGGCGTCVKTCAFSASSIDISRKLSIIDTTRCLGCGNCVVACPTGARDLITFPEKYMFKAIDILSNGVSDDSTPKVLALLCSNSGYQAVNKAGEMAAVVPEMKYPVNVLPLQLECGGNIDTQYILRAFQKGFDGIALTVCEDGYCHHVVGNTDMKRRIGLFREVLRSRHINDDRLRVIQINPNDGKYFIDEINSFCQELKSTMNITQDLHDESTHKTNSSHKDSKKTIAA